LPLRSRTMTTASRLPFWLLFRPAVAAISFSFNCSVICFARLVHRSPDNVPDLTDAERLDWLRLIRSENVGPVGIMAQTPQVSRPVGARAVA
jgi:hypothetical protein